MGKNKLAFKLLKLQQKEQPHPSTASHHYLILREYFISFSPSDVMNASQPCQIQVTTFIFTVVSRDRQNIYLHIVLKLTSVKQEKNFKVQAFAVQFQGNKTTDKFCSTRNKNKGYLPVLKMWSRRQSETNLCIRHVPAQLYQLLGM